MIEEASGTRMYETKKIAAQRTIAKKQAKVAEINTVLSEEITPTLEKLRSERTGYMKWSSNHAEIEKLQRFATAAVFYEANKNTEGSSDKRAKALDEQNALEDEVSDLLVDIYLTEGLSCTLPTHNTGRVVCVWV